MYPKHFFEKFWESEQKNQLFVCMPFHNNCDSRFEDIFKTAAKEVGLEAIRVKEDIKPNEIKSKILDGIANSKLILIDLSNDPKSSCKHTHHINGNVLYEAGISHAMREPEAIIMIREEKIDDNVDFDIKGMTINIPPFNKFSKEWLFELLKKTLDSYEWYRSKRVEAISNSIDDICLKFLLQIGRRPDGYNHFNTLTMENLLEKQSILRLLDLEILRFKTGKERAPEEHAYHWTSFGREVMKYLGIPQFTLEEFKKERPEEYEAIKKANEEWAKNHSKRSPNKEN